MLQLKISIQEKLETIKLLDGEFLELVPEGELTTEIEQADGFKEGIYAAIIGIDKCSAMVRARTSEGTSEPCPLPIVHDRVKLLKLILRPFNGEITAWTTFWESFDSSIHSNRDISDTDKFNYFNSLLTGTAQEAVSGLLLTSATYTEAVAVLKKQLGMLNALRLSTWNYS